MLISFERDGKGLNLTFEVRNGIARHTSGEMPSTLEGRVVRPSHHIAYINHDIADALRAGVLQASDIPWNAQYVLGRSHSQRINTLITDMVTQSVGDCLKMSDEISKAFDELHTFMFESVYKNPVAKAEDAKLIYIIKRLYEYFINYTHLLNRRIWRHTSRGGCQYGCL